jgi:hypothetical protein
VYWKGSLFWQRVFFLIKFSAFSSAKFLLSCIHHASLFFLSPVDGFSHEGFPFLLFSWFGGPLLRSRSYLFQRSMNSYNVSLDHNTVVLNNPRPLSR